jgi:hypothetical protein
MRVSGQVVMSSSARTPSWDGFPACSIGLFGGQRVEGRQELANLFAAEHHGKPTRPSGARGVEISNVALQHIAVEEQDSGQGLVLRAGGDVTLDGQVREKRFDIGRGKVLWMAEAFGRSGEAKELLDPAHVACFRADGEMANTCDGADLIEEFHESSSNGLSRMRYRGFW